MSRFAPRIRLPKYRHHKAKDLALVTFDGRDYYLGKYGSPESRAAYDQLIGHWVAHGRCLPPDPQVLTLPAPAVQPGASALTTVRTAPSPAFGGEALSVGEFVLAYLKYAKARYARHGRFYSIRAAFRILLKLFRDLPLVDFGPKRLMEVRQTLVGRDLIRREINRRVQWIRKGIAWAVQEELCPGEVLYRLNAVEILRRDEAQTRESQPVMPVDEAIVFKTIEHVAPEVAAMVRVQLLTGARSGEVCLMKGASIDMSKDVWLFKPEKHKTQSRGQSRVIPIGKRAQEVIGPFLTGDPNVYLFSPIKAEKRRRQKLHEARITPGNQGNNLGTNKRKNPDRIPGAKYTSLAYGRAIRRAIQKAFALPPHLAKRLLTPSGRKKAPRLETREEWWSRLTKEQRQEVQTWWKTYHWHPHQLRHSAATAIREQFGLDSAQALLGHANLSATQVYASLQTAKAIEVMRQVG